MEEHFRAEESLVANVNFYHVVVESAMNEFLELIRLNELSIGFSLFIIGIELFKHILAHISVFLLNFGCNLIRVTGYEVLTTILQCLECELGNVTAG